MFPVSYDTCNNYKLLFVRLSYVMDSWGWGSLIQPLPASSTAGEVYFPLIKDSLVRIYFSICSHSVELVYLDYNYNNFYSAEKLRASVAEGR